MNGEVNITIQTGTFEFTLKFDRNVSFIRGDSGTGKTYLCELIEQSRIPDSGVTMSVDRDIPIVVMPVNTLNSETSIPWNEKFKKSINTLFIIDEDCDCLTGNPYNLSKVIKNTSNYYVIISRKLFADIPYSVYNIYELKVTEKVEYSKVLIRNQRIYKNSVMDITPNLIVTEDSGAGYLFFTLATNVAVQSAKSKTKVQRVLVGLLNQHKNNILLVVDGAAFGPEIEKVKKVIDDSEANVVLYMPESFEWLMLNSLQFSTDAVIQLKLIDYINLIDYTKFFSVERYFTSAFTEACEELGFTYNKSEQSLPEVLLSRDNMSHLLKMIPNIKFSTEEN